LLFREKILHSFRDSCAVRAGSDGFFDRANQLAFFGFVKFCANFANFFRKFFIAELK
jgi:hypothetical protein